MAQAYQAYPQNKGTLVPGQSISVNNYTVQVERYLSQGGFAHVYLVRTPQPVYNTTHHVLKRIAVANESMLTEVKKEVDIMRLLKGHPNIVHLIDAAWHKLQNNTFEVFILMEFCPGGGIIDMMNRRLRERLTEAEILQIFVDVCEGVAYMHNSRPPLLHRDLKVENILQSSPTSFKLCDFGSATTVSNPPTNMQEIRAVEADLNRHTTLQYRAPEMVDVYSKRPINEKSDVWALGVLLYKLCYYTTPFEEHGPLAILNVQYRTPSYPVYSQEMNMLIASMLREHGTQRPTVFELLNHVHRLRGTKSRFTYSIPSPQPLLSPHQSHVKQPLSSSPNPNPLEGLVTYGHVVKSPPSNAVANNQGVQARDRVLEAIAPMRRGRPNTNTSSQQHSVSRPASPHKDEHSRFQQLSKNHTHNDFTVEQERAWKAATERTANQGKSSGIEDIVWSASKPNKDVQKSAIDRPIGFGDDFAEKLWSAPDPNLNSGQQTRLTPSPNRVVMSIQRTAETPAFSGTSKIRPKQDRLMLSRNKERDAFEGLGLMANIPKSAPTLGEARKLRTGLAMVSTPVNNINQNDFLREVDHKMKANSQRPTPSPKSASRYLATSPFIPQSASPVSTTGSPGNASTLSPHTVARSGLGTSPSAESGTAELRFPSVEELDAQFNPSANALYPSAVNEASARYISHQPKQLGSRPPLVSRSSNNLSNVDTDSNYLRPTKGPSHSTEGTRSEQVTGVAMRDSKDNRRFPKRDELDSWDSPMDKNAVPHRPFMGDVPQLRPLVVRKGSSTILKPEIASTSQQDSNMMNKPPTLPSRPLPSTSSRDWLTGDDDMEEIKPSVTSNVPVIRDSPSKRASFVENKDSRIISGSVAQHVEAPEGLIADFASVDVSPTVSKFKRAFPAVEVLDGTQERPREAKTSRATDSWNSNKKEDDPDSSSADEGPEDPAYRTAAQKQYLSKPRARQSSVHDLVYQYGGRVSAKDGEKEKEREKEKEKEKAKEKEKVPSRSTQYNIGPSDYVPSKSRQPIQGLTAPSSQAVKPKTPSPTLMSFKPSFVTQSKPVQAPSERPQPPPSATKPIFPSMTSNADGKSPGPPKARPQSMFMFPSKSTDTSSTPAVSTLIPPPDPRQRAVRRTSISDMVQLYENISGTGTSQAPASPVSVPPVPKPFTAKRPPSYSSETHSKSNLTSTKPASSIPTPFNDTARSDSFTSGIQSALNEVMRNADELPRSPEKVNRPLPPTDFISSSQQTSVDDTNTRIHGTSSKETQSTGASTSRTTMPITLTKAPTISHSTTFAPKGPFRKPPISLTEEAGPSNADESSSPERPYQGVGRLIDQWQKKSAEADQSRPGAPAKRDILGKRAGIIHIDDR